MRVREKEMESERERERMSERERERERVNARGRESHFVCCLGLRGHMLVSLDVSMSLGEVGGWGRDPKKCTGRDWGMGSSTI